MLSVVLQISAGGSLSNTLVGLSRLGQADHACRGSGGLAVAMAGPVGTDPLGRFFTAQEQKAGVHSLAEPVPDSNTGQPWACSVVRCPGHVQLWLTSCAACCWWLCCSAVPYQPAQLAHISVLPPVEQIKEATRSGSPGQACCPALFSMPGMQCLACPILCLVSLAPVLPPSLRAHCIVAGTVMVLTTPDANRTFLSYLGEAQQELRLTEAVLSAIEHSRMLIIEGYLWEMPCARTVLIEAIAAARRGGAAVALTAGDAGLVQRHRADLWAALEAGADLLFCNRWAALPSCSECHTPDW